jgi:putative phage-type endonuclease
MSFVFCSLCKDLEGVKLNKYLQDTISAEFIGNPESGTQEWHELREGSIGGSEVGTIAGLNQYESAYTLWHKKTGLMSDKIEGNWSIRFGNAFETPILNMFAEEHPELEVMETGTFRSKQHNWQHANPDGIALNSATGLYEVIEVKTSRREWEEIPQSYIAQVQWYMHVLGMKTARIVAVAGWQWFEEVIEYDQFFAEALESHAKRFYNACETNVKPDWDGSKSTYETVRRFNTGMKDESVEIPQHLAVQLAQASALSKEATTELNKTKSMVHDAIGAAKYATTNGQVVALKQSRSGGSPYLVIKG